VPVYLCAYIRDRSLNVISCSYINIWIVSDPWKFLSLCICVKDLLLIENLYACVYRLTSYCELEVDECALAILHDL